MLTLPIKKKWFDMIVSGEKKEEYREIKPYYDSRFMNAFGFLLVGGQMVYGEAAPEEIRKPWPVLVVFRNGYSKDSPEVVCKCTLQFGKGKPEWGAEPGKLYYVLKIEKVEEVRNHALNVKKAEERYIYGSYMFGECNTYIDEPIPKTLFYEPYSDRFFESTIVDVMQAEYRNICQN